MNSLFAGGMPALSALVGCFNLNPLGYPRVAIGSPAEGWHPETLTAANQEKFLEGMRAVQQDALRFKRRSENGRGELEIPNTMWKLAIDGPDQFRLWRPRFGLSFDLSSLPWTDLIDLQKEYVPETGSRRRISQQFRRTRSDAELFRDVKTMTFSRVELSLEYGSDPRALGMFEHQLTMQFNANTFQPVKATFGTASALNPRDPLIGRWKPHSSPPPSAPFDYEAPTPAQGIPVTDPYYPYRVFYERDPNRDHFHVYMSCREPDNAALSLELGLRTLWDRIENFVETTDRSFPQVTSLRAASAK